VAKSDPANLVWRKSTASGASECVEVAFFGETVLVRHSRRSWTPLSFSRSEWMAFLAGVRDGEFDLNVDGDSANLG
jgi:hypothetical protein